jgi:hypothetical protein
MSATTKTKRHRWGCPNGKHPAVLAPRRLRRIDLRRYCLPCSVKAGVWVERMCSVKEEAAERSRKKQARKAQSERAAARRAKDAAAKRQHEREHIAGIDVARELDRLWAYGVKLYGGIPITNVHGTTHRVRVPGLTVSRSQTYQGPRGCSGRAWATRIHITAGRDVSPVRLCGVLAHEVAHVLTPTEHHSERFWSVLVELVQHAYGPFPIERLPGEHRENQRVIEAAMTTGCVWLRQGGSPPPRPRVTARTGRATVARAKPEATPRRARARARVVEAEGGPEILRELLRF